MKRKFQIWWICLGLVILALLAACATTSQSTTETAAISGYRLNVNRLFGYSSGNQIKGSFRLSVVGVSNIRSIDFLIDGRIMDTVNNDPFQLDFQTERYSFGMHTLRAFITTTDGKTIETPDRQFEFATAQQEQESVAAVLVPLGSIVLVVVALGLGSQFLFMKKKNREFVPLGAVRHYGWAGGAICPKCKRPTMVHPFLPHFGFRLKFDFCENCGKWSLMRVLPESELRLAEVEERQAAEKVQPALKTEEEKLKEILDESKYSK